jgi:hypothetical protein
MQNILKIDNEGKTSLSSVFSPDKQKKAELALQNYKSRQSSIASSRGWGADEITKKNKESIDLYIGEIEPLINHTLVEIDSFTSFSRRIDLCSISA